MVQSVGRRRFLAHCAGLAAAGGWSAWSTVGSPGGPQLAHAIDPVERNGRAKFKFSLAAYSYRSLLKPKKNEPAAMTLHDFIDDCARFGLEGTELTSYYFPETVTPEYLRGLKQHAFRLGLDVSGTAIRNDFGQIDDAGLRRDIEHVKTWCKYAEILGAPVIRVFAGKVKGDPQKAHARIVAGLEECCETAGKHGVHLALENHGGPTATADGLLALVKDVKSPWFGVNLDTGNFHTDDIYGDLARVAPYALNVQVKVVVSGPERKNKRPADFNRLADILRDADYRGYIVLEYEENENPRKASGEYLKKLRRAFLRSRSGERGTPNSERGTEK